MPAPPARPTAGPLQEEDVRTATFPASPGQQTATAHQAATCPTWKPTA